MLEQQGSSVDCELDGGSVSIDNNDSPPPSVSNGDVNGTCDVESGGGHDDGEGDNVNATSHDHDMTTTSSTTTTTVRIHTTYKKRASKFMNRPNVQNGLGANSFLHPYGGGGSVGSGFGGASGPSLGAASRLSHSNSVGHHGSLFGSSKHSNNNLHQQPHHRSLATRSSLFGGGSVGGGMTSPHGTNTTTASTTTTTVEGRPPFVTTVTRGRFLPSKFDLMIEKSLFTFSSRPKPVGLITRHQCSLSGGPLKENNSQNCQPRGAHDYFNVMWDPHIYRGTTTTLTSSLKQPDTDLSRSRDQQDRYKRRRAFLAGSNNNINHNHAYNNSNNSTITPVGPLGSNTSNRNRYRMTTKVTSRSRTFPPPEGRHQVHVQTEEYLEDLTRDTMSRAPEVDAIVQTDPIEDDEFLSSPNGAKAGFLPEAKSGIDASTQVLPGELITFDERVQPIVEAVVGKILEQALLETMEEEEIGALKAQQNRFLEKRKEEERELKKLQEQQERISAEKERLKRHLERQLVRQQQQHSHNGDSDDTGTPLLLASSAIVNNNNNSMTIMSGEGVLTSFAPLWMSTPKPEESSDPPVDPENIQHNDEDDTYNPNADGFQSRVCSPDTAGDASEMEQIDPAPKSLDNDEEEKDEAVAGDRCDDENNDETTNNEDIEIDTNELKESEEQPEVEPSPVEVEQEDDTVAIAPEETEQEGDNEDAPAEKDEQEEGGKEGIPAGEDEQDKDPEDTPAEGTEQESSNEDAPTEADSEKAGNAEENQIAPTEDASNDTNNEEADPLMQSSQSQLPNGAIPNLESG